MKLTQDFVDSIHEQNKLALKDEAVWLLGIRGFDLTEGSPRKNDFGIYDDTIVVCFRGGIEAYEATTDPSKQYIDNPVNKEGTAVLRPGVWTYKLGLHRGNAAFVQDDSVVVYRLDRGGHYVIGSDGRAKIHSGFFGINIHSGGTTNEVGPFSAGCQAVACHDHAWGEPWQTFYHLVVNRMRDAKQHQIKYVLTDNPEAPEVS